MAVSVGRGRIRAVAGKTEHIFFSHRHCIVRVLFVWLARIPCANLFHCSPLYSFPAASSLVICATLCGFCCVGVCSSDIIFYAAPRPAVVGVRAFSAAISEGENVVVPLVTDSLEWTLSSPPPLHQFEEPPLIVEVEHLDTNPGAEVEAVLEAQGETITDIVGKEQWVDNDPALYEGLIPQNKEWTEFVDEKTGETVFMDEFGNRVDQPIA
eukprot:CAMPEP_0181029622 /NCGR_PEP_ID=MMETSP1070-20121207/5293_1 /TAXON_ID=265543 /ORGANISM="Minutocellus polymorphus, Strain NH13" /LENGTH=210 /DNA_ID=CAMNT_0023106937 /DNA_START=1 /DNA_END=633 /DNA_ORIENTATION=-